MQSSLSCPSNSQTPRNPGQNLQRLLEMLLLNSTVDTTYLDTVNYGPTFPFFSAYSSQQ